MDGKEVVRVVERGADEGGGVGWMNNLVLERDKKVRMGETVKQVNVKDVDGIILNGKIGVCERWKKVL